MRKITVNKSGKLGQETINLVSVDVPNSSKSTNNTNKQKTSQYSTFEGGVSFQSTIPITQLLLLLLVLVIVTSIKSFQALGCLGFLESLFLGLFE